MGIAASRQSAAPGGSEQALVELLAAVDLEGGAGAFYDRICESICDRTPVRRAALLLWNAGYRGVLPAGSHGVDRDLLSRIEGTLDETPIAQRALGEDRTVVVSGSLRDQIPHRYAEMVPNTCIACTPIAAGSAWIGVLFTDRDGEDFEFTAADEELLGTLARVAALASAVEQGTRQRERARRLSERVALTRDVHEQVIQRLFATSLALGVEGPLEVTERERCEREVRLAIGELRSALARPSGRPPATTLRRLLNRMQRSEPALRVRWREDFEIGESLEAISQAVVTEALANARKHADPTSIVVSVDAPDGALEIEVLNDGVRPEEGGGGTGLGLRLAAFEALDRRGVVEFGPVPPDGWRVRLVVPLEEPVEP